MELAYNMIPFEYVERIHDGQLVSKYKSETIEIVEIK